MKMLRSATTRQSLSVGEPSSDLEALCCLQMRGSGPGIGRSRQRSSSGARYSTPSLCTASNNLSSHLLLSRGPPARRSGSELALCRVRKTPRAGRSVNSLERRPDALHQRHDAVSRRDRIGFRHGPNLGGSFLETANGKTRGAPAVGIGAKLPLEQPLTNRRHRPALQLCACCTPAVSRFSRAILFGPSLIWKTPCLPIVLPSSGFRQRHVFIPRATEGAMGFLRVCLAVTTAALALAVVRLP